MSHEVLALKLSPLQVGHLFLLHEAGSGFLGEHPQSDADAIHDLVASVFICGRPWRQTKASLGRWWTFWLVRLWSIATRGFNPVIEAAKFRQYIADAFEVKNVKSRKTSKYQLQTPIHQRLYTMLAEDLGVPHDRALDYSVRDAVDAWSAMAERRGLIEFFTPHELAVWEFAKQQDRALIEAGVLDDNGRRIKPYGTV